jgi:hypothetical protein
MRGSHEVSDYRRERCRHCSGTALTNSIPPVKITLALADEFPNYSICGLPFYLSGETPDWHSLAHRTEFPGIKLLPKSECRSR